MVFISKKSRAQTRTRRLKKLKFEQQKSLETADGDVQESSPDQNGVTNKKRPRSESTSSETDGKAEEKQKEPQVVQVPENLTTKQAKKFRKEARRKAKAQGLDDSTIRFVGPHEEKISSGETTAPSDPSESTDEPAPKKKKRSTKEFPRINDLLAEHEAEKKKEKEELAKQEKENQVPLHIRQRYVALDCEMVGIGSGGKQSALARVSLVDWDGSVVIDTFVQVPDRVTDFRTHVSGVRSKDISSTSSSAMELHECRNLVASLMKDKVLVGHSLKNDLSALLLDHPKVDIRDTAKYRPLMRRQLQKFRPRKLRDLVKEHVGTVIQADGEEHSSIDDAQASMDLFKCFREAWEKELSQHATKSHKRKF
eukprot:scaffold88881_cov49-Attheya_sp.AAC.6